MSKKSVAAVLLAAVTLSTTALAQGVSFGAVDMNQDGFVSFEELSAVVPNVTEDSFSAADMNQDNLLDAEEFEAVQP